MWLPSPSSSRNPSRSRGARGAAPRWRPEASAPGRAGVEVEESHAGARAVRRQDAAREVPGFRARRRRHRHGRGGRGGGGDFEPTIEPVSKTAAEENDAAFARPESPPRRVTRRSANLLDETATRRMPSSTRRRTAPERGERVERGAEPEAGAVAAPQGPPLRSASLASTADADKTMETDEAEEEEVDLEAKTISPPRRSTRRSARNVTNVEVDTGEDGVAKVHRKAGHQVVARGVRRRGPGRDGARRRGLMRVYTF